MNGPITMALTDDDLLSAITADYLALADLLDQLRASEWETPSMCVGWRVREVVAHVTMPARYTREAFTAELQACGFDFTRLSNQIAARDADLGLQVLIGNLRDDALHHWAPPGGGRRGALNHVVIHGLDVTVPLGKDRRSSRTESIRVRPPCRSPVASSSKASASASREPAGRRAMMIRGRYRCIALATRA